MSSRPPQRCGRYWMFDEFARGGMASIHFGRLVGARGFSLTVAIKRLLPMFSADSQFVTMFADEARIASRIRHPNVVPTLDVIEENDGLSIVMEYVRGESLMRLIRLAQKRNETIPQAIAVRIVVDVLQGLHAAHEARSENGTPLEIIHRDVSPQNILIGTDGIARVVDFGIARAIDRGVTTRDGAVKGKFRWISPEQIASPATIDRRADIFAVGVILWEMLAQKPLREHTELPSMVASILNESIDLPSKFVPDIPRELEAITMRALRKEPFDRYPLAKDMATALSEACAPAPHSRVAEWLHDIADEWLDERAAQIRQMEETELPDDATLLPPIKAEAKKESTLFFALIGLAVLFIFSAVGYRLWVFRTLASQHPTPVPIPVSAASSPITTVPIFDAGAAPATTTSIASKPPVTPHAHAPNAKPKDCRIPYTIDSSGIRVPRPECM